MSQSKNVKTIGGVVNAKVLEELQEEFDTTQILDAVDTIDEIRYRICDPEGMRDDLLRLHGLAHALINGDYSNVSEEDGPIWELADDLEDQISDWIDKLRNLTGMLDQLVSLMPDEGDEEEEEE
jgi:hypothetical protein